SAGEKGLDSASSLAAVGRGTSAEDGRCRSRLGVMGIGGRSFLAVVSVAAALCGAAVAQARPQTAAWHTWWGRVSQAQGAFTLSSQAPVTPGETHSALLTSRASWADQTFSYTLTTLGQLRVGSAP